MVDDVSLHTNHIFISIVIVTYNRERYLTELLESIALQELKEEIELILVDNGCEIPVNESHAEVINSLGISTTYLRFENNILTHKRIEEGVRNASGIFILCPGDDDILEKKCISEFKLLYDNMKEASLLSVGSICINSSGSKLQRSFVPQKFIDQQSTLANLLCSNQYWMPATAFRKEYLDFSYVPHTRTAIDWWIWIQCALRGPSSISEKLLVGYRLHENQWQHDYGDYQFELDSLRMLGSLLVDPNFVKVLKSWSNTQVNDFFQVLIYHNQNFGKKKYFLSLLNLVLLDLLREKIDSKSLEVFFSILSTRFNVIPTPDVLKNFLVKQDIVSVSQQVWRELDIGAVWDVGDLHHLVWLQLLNIPKYDNNLILIEFHPVVHNKLNITISKKKLMKDLTMDFDIEPSEKNLTILLREISAFHDEIEKIGVFAKNKFISHIFLKLETNLLINKIVSFMRKMYSKI